MSARWAAAALAALAFPLVAAGLGRACEAPPAEQIVGHRELVARTGRIALAIAEAFDKKTLRYRFRTIEILKGKVGKSFWLEGFPPPSEPDEDLQAHSDPGFWSRYGGNSTNSPDCRIHPTFELGRRYLVFLDEPYHHKSFEGIDSEDDRWLSAVRKLVRTPKKGG